MTASPSFFAGPQSPPRARARLHSPAERLRSLADEKRRLHHDFLALEHALIQKKISFDEYCYYLEQVHHGKQEHEALRLLEKEEQGIRREIEAARRPKAFPFKTIAFLLLALVVASTLVMLPQARDLTGFAFFSSEKVPSSPGTVLIELPCADRCDRLADGTLVIAYEDGSVLMASTNDLKIIAGDGDDAEGVR